MFFYPPRLDLNFNPQRLQSVPVRRVALTLLLRVLSRALDPR